MLRVWLPLTKDLRQQGLSNATVTNNGATFNSAGKLGGCYKTSSSGYIDLGYNGNQINSSSLSFGGWFKFNQSEISSAISGKTYTSSAKAATGNLIGNNSYGGISLQWNSNDMYTSGSFSSMSVQSCLRTSTNGARATSSYTLPFDTWIHIFLTYDKDGNTLGLWINGELKYSYTQIAFTDAASRNLILNWGAIAGGNGPSAYIPFLVNDVRIYDHCLSLMEVKELAKGLALHYPLNRQGWGQENLLKNSGDLTLWNKESGINCEYDSTVNMYKIYSTTRESSRWGIYQDYAVTVSTDTNYTFSLTGKTDGYSAYLSFGAGTSWPTNYIAFTNNKQRLSKTLTIPAGTTNIRVYLAMYPQTGGGHVYFEKPKLEEGSTSTPWCPNSSDTLATTMGLNSTTEYDCSGFCNNGTRTGTFSWSSDTPKYAVSTHIGANTQKIHISNFPTSGFGNSYSFAWWGKRNSNSPMFWGFSDGIRLNGMYNGVYWNTGDGNSNPIYKPNTTTTITAPSVNVWHHYVMTGDGTTCKLYVDGELYGQAKAYKAISGTSIYINGWDSSTSYCHTNADMSDFRIYATALSASDVKSLYQNCATIDSSGNVYGTIHEV